MAITVYEIRTIGNPTREDLAGIIENIVNGGIRKLSRRQGKASHPLLSLDATKGEIGARDGVRGPGRECRCKAKVSSVDAVLTLRRDLLGIRKALLADNSKGALRRVDYTLDMIDNYLGEN